MPPVDDKAAADKAAVDKVAADKVAADKKTGASEGAASVAEAVKRVADAAVAAVQKTEPEAAQDFRFSGSLNGKFEIRGLGFGTGGTVRINGHQAVTNEWGNALIVGKMPAGVTAGSVNVEVAIDSTTSQKGTFKL